MVNPRDIAGNAEEGGGGGYRHNKHNSITLIFTVSYELVVCVLPWMFYCLFVCLFCFKILFSFNRGFKSRTVICCFLICFGGVE